MSYKELYAEYERVKSENEYLRKMIFGAQTERHTTDVDSSQLNLFGGEQQQEEQIQETESISYDRKKKKHAGRNKLPENLPVEVVTIEPKEDTTKFFVLQEKIIYSLEFISNVFLLCFF